MTCADACRHRHGATQAAITRSLDQHGGITAELHAARRRPCYVREQEPPAQLVVDRDAARVHHHRHASIGRHQRGRHIHNH
mmetsp:Transcript_118203/g.328639  ORF Transcript_118203/g.328639 Transcript_118203/m.328639 type:complete len:81 (-) Transcript_118203:259-501(-)